MYNLSYRSYWHYIILKFYLALCLAFYLKYILHIYIYMWMHVFWHSIWHSLWHSIRHLALAVEVRQCQLISGACGWGPAVPIEIWSLRLRSGSAIWDRALAVEVRQCPLRSGACGWGPAVPTEIWRSRKRAACSSAKINNLYRKPHPSPGRCGKMKVIVIDGFFKIIGRTINNRDVNHWWASKMMVRQFGFVQDESVWVRQ